MYIEKAVETVMINIACVFPGQGSQAVGMLGAWGDHPAVRAVVQEASDALSEDLAALIRTGPKELLSLTTNTQPVMLVAGVAAYRAWVAEGGAAPAVAAGHSLGEYSALVAAGVLTLTDAVRLVRLRGQAMQEAVPVGVGAMAAVLGLDAAKVAAGCAEAQRMVRAETGREAEVVEAVNFNDPAQTVIAGSKAAVDKACEIVKALGAKRALLLPVSAPFHSSLMKPAAERLKLALATTSLSPAQFPVLNNVDVATPHDADAIRDALYRQAFGPVRWVETVLALKSMGVTAVLECGPGKVLTGMSKRIDATVISQCVFDPASLKEAQGVVA
jgi:[acyl-carrier-protein] S-malonyltransferase